MAFVVKRSDDGTLVVKWRDAAGRQHQKRTRCRTRAEARRLAEEIQYRVERQRLGLEPLPTEQRDMPFSSLFEWWWKEYGSRLRGETVESFGRKHLLPELGSLRLRDLTSARIGRFSRRRIASLRRGR